MTTQSQELSIIDLYANERHMQRDDFVVVAMNTMMPHSKEGKPIGGKAELIFFLQVAKRFDLDPFAREIYMIVNRGKVLPYISVDGYAKMANRQAEYDGCAFDYEQDGDGRFLSVTCTMHRKDRSHPTVVTEFMAECYKPDSEAWKKSPGRMLRHRAFTQAVRLTFGISGAFDDDGHAQPMLDVTPVQKAEDKPLPPLQPRAPTAPKRPPSPGEVQEKEKSNVERNQERVDRYMRPAEPSKPAPDASVPVDPHQFLKELDEALATAKSEDELKTIYNDFEVETVLAGNDQAIERAQDFFIDFMGRLKVD